MRPRASRRPALFAFLLLLAFGAGNVCPASAGDGAGEWLDIAADARLDAARREYAAQKIVMLADDSSASILIAALKGEDGRDSALRKQVAATLLGEIGAVGSAEAGGADGAGSTDGAEAALLEAAFGPEYFLAESAKRALAALYSRLPDNELYTLLTRGARNIGGSGAGGDSDAGGNADAGAGGDDWLALSLRQAEYRGRFKAFVMAGLARKYNSARSVSAARGAARELSAEPLPESLPEPLRWCVWEGLLDIEPELRRASVEVLPHIHGGEATERLAALLYSETDKNVLLAALGVMARLRPPQYGEAVERHTKHSDPRVAVEALAALHAMGYAGAFRSVAAFVNHPSTPVRRRVIEFLSGSKNPAAVEPLSAALFDRVGANRAAAARGLGGLGFPSAVGALSPLLHDARPEVREEAAVALSRFGVVGVTSRLVDEVRAGEAVAPPFRLAAVRALGRMGDARAIPALTEISETDDSDPALREAARRAIEILRGE